MKRPKGFSLIELLIVVAIILIIVAIAIPNLLRARMASNEASAVGGLRTINTAEVTYFSSYDQGFGTLDKIGTPLGGDCTASSDSACLIDSVLTQGTKNGYIFTVTPDGDGNTTYTSTAYAITQGETGQREFCSDQSAVIYFNATASTCVQGTDSPISTPPEFTLVRAGRPELTRNASRRSLLRAPFDLFFAAASHDFA